MNMTLNQYILNPMGAKNAVMNATAREAIRSSYIHKYDAILLRERGKINYTLYKDSKNNRFYAHFKIPSEVIEKFYYDTVLEFYADENIKNTSDLFQYYVKFYSNDPAFVYTYAYVFSHNGLFVDCLSSKMSKKALRKEAGEKNPYNQIGYVKSIYFAYLTMKAKGLNNTEKFNAEASSFSVRALSYNVEQADKKVGDREAAGEKLKKVKSAIKAKNDSRNTDISTKTSNTSKNVKYTKTIGTVKSVKNVKTTRNKNKS